MLRRSLCIHLYPSSPCGMCCYCSTSWRSFLGNVATGKDTSHVPDGFEYPKGGRLEMDGDSEGQSRGYDITSLQTVPCHIVGMESFSCLKRNCFQQSDRLARHVGEDLIHIGLASK